MLCIARSQFLILFWPLPWIRSRILMSLVGKHYSSSQLQTWFRNVVPAITLMLLSFPNLHYYLGGLFQTYRTTRYGRVRNAIFRSCLPRPGQTSPSSLSLQELEDAINIFRIRYSSQAVQNQFRSRLSSNDYDISFGVALELLLGRRFAAVLGQSNVSVYPRLTSGRFSDILVNLVGRRVYIEVGNLSSSKPEKKIQELLDKGASYLWSRLSSRCFLDLEIDTAELVFNNQRHISAPKSLAKLKQEIDRMRLSDLAGLTRPT